MISIATPGRISLYGSMKDFPLRTLLAKIEILLTRCGLDQAGLSRRSGVSEDQFSKWKGQAQKIEQAMAKGPLKKSQMRGGPNIWDGVRIAEALKVTAEYLASPDMGSPPVVLTDDEKAIITAYRAHRPELDALIRAIASLPAQPGPPPAAGDPQHPGRMDQTDERSPYMRPQRNGKKPRGQDAG